MSDDSFSKEFNTLRELGQDTFVLRGSTIIVELLPEEEVKTAGGIVIATTMDQVKGNSINNHKLQVGKVLMCGPGYWVEEDKAFEPLEVSPGAVVILPQFATQYISVFPGISRPTGNKLGMIKQDQILAYYPSEAAFETAKAKLN